jgi:YXWGXW repeat-containing protein
MRHRMGSVLLFIALAAGVGACTVSTPPAYETEVAPPPPQYEEVAVRPGSIWVHGHWVWNGAWQWRPGFYETERPGYVYREGGWERRGNRWRWSDGRWEQGQSPNGVIIRDHRQAQPEPQRPIEPGDQPGTTVVPSRQPDRP